MSLLFTSMLYVLSATATVNEPSDSLKQQDFHYFMQKSKHQQTAADILMIAGIAGGSVTLIVALFTVLGNGLLTIVSLGALEPKHHSYTIPALLSVAAIGGGIVLYSAASRSKRIAKAITLNAGMGFGPVLQQQIVHNHTYPTLLLKINF